MNKRDMIDLMTGAGSSKKTYYTELKKTVDQLKKKNLQLEIMNDITTAVNIGMDIREVLQQVVKKLNWLISFDDCHFVFLDEEQSLLHMCKEESCQMELNSHACQTIKGIQLLQVEEDMPPTYLKKEGLQSLQIKTLLLVPLHGKRKEIGVLIFGRKSNKKWSDEEWGFLEQLSNQLALTFENVLLYGEVLHAKQEWEDTFKAVDDMIIVFDREGQVYKANDSANVFFDLTPLKEASQALIHETFSLGTPGFKEILLRHGTIMEMHAYPIHNKEMQVYGVIAYYKNVTERRNMEAQLLHADKLGAIGEMAAGVAHELNSPLTAILGNAQLLLRNTLPEHADYDILTDIKNCGDRCRQIIQSLLTFSRQDEYKFHYYSINEAIHQVMNLLKFQLEKNQITIHLSLQEGLPYLKGSQQQIEQIIINLVLNAKDALESLQGSTEKNLTISSYIEEENVVVQVTDNGIGMERERMPLIFHPFHTTKDRDKGTGLGLSVSLGIAKDHGGKIDVWSAPGEGSKFSLRLPLSADVKRRG